jgi:hypothetical protein
MSDNEGEHHDGVEDDNGILTVSDISDQIIKEFIDDVLLLAQRKANNSTIYSARDIIMATKLILPSSMRKMTKGAVTLFGLALKEERNNAPVHILQLQPRVRMNGKPGLDGRYAKWVKTQFDLEEKNTYYREKAKMINEDLDREAAGLIDMELHQSRGLWELEKLVCLKL